MSRHVIYANGDTEVVVGWDQPMQTYFGQKVIEGEEEDTHVFWLGTEPCEFQDLNVFYDRMKQLDHPLDDATVARLVADRAEPWAPSPLQRSMCAWLADWPRP